MAEIIIMPKLGFNMDEGQLVKWHRRVGETVKKGEVLFEINTGAIARGYRTQPYPAMTLLRRLREFGGEIVLNSDSHHTSHLCCAFDQAISLAKEAGFTHTNVLTLSGRKPVSWREFQGEETR